MEKIVLKLGGSIITHKDVKNFPMTIEKIKTTANKYIRLTILERLVNEIFTSNILPLIVVNGVGPFGHYLVKNWDLLPEKEIVHKSVAYLNEIVVDKFQKIGLPIDRYAPCETCCYLGDGKYDIKKLFDFGAQTLNQKKILSTYGDIVPVARDVKSRYGKYEVLSGDDLAVLLAELWGAEKIIMVLDVNGVYNKNPKKYKDATKIPVIKAEDELNFLVEGDETDVTGGIRKKAEKLQLAAKKGIKGQMISGLVENNLTNALLGDETLGTLFIP
jgi:isopentenyl phosphate kinase